MIKANMKSFVHPVPFLILLCFHLQHNMAATDSILPGQEISISNTIISAGDVFELGFFTPGNSSNYYVGIWYKTVSKQTVVWIANRNYPVSGTSGVLTINTDGNLMISDHQFIYMVTNTTLKGNTSATLLDSGNLVLKDSNDVILWQSFDNPSHAFLPGMKLGINKRSGSALSLVSWRSSDDPGTGTFSLQVDANRTSQFLIMKESQIYWTSGTWNGKIFSLVPEMRLNYIYNISYISNENESYFTYSLYNSSIISLLVLGVSGKINQLTWVESSQQWILLWSQPRNNCDEFSFCGSFGVCNNKINTLCQCLFGFEPHSSEQWRQGDIYSGCARKVPLKCENTTAVNGSDDKFLKMSYMKYPANAQVEVLSAKECKFACLSNCSCSAYAHNRSGGCSTWNGSLLNLQQLPDKDKYGETIYVKLAASELPGSGGNKNLLFVIIPVVASLGVLFLGCYFCCRRKKKLKQKGKMEPGQNILVFDMSVSTATTNNEVSRNKAAGGGKSNDSGLPLFSFASVSAATDNFSAENKLGEGGFGPVYKGKLLKGHEIAVKRLSKKSGQGLEELKNEAMLIAKLQHRNLVKLLGCCLEQEEKILIYEYMPNKSLDNFLFDPSKRGLLDWVTRVRIVEGIAQGLLYLHQYSRLKIIHRDLKASNILLDAELNPKISDFGMARIFGGNQSQANTNRIVGTYGYMAPEYALEGIFSVKSDVFSFGVLLLEIVSGKKNTGFYHSDSLNLLGYAWDLWKDDKALDLMDPVWEHESSKNILLRYIHVALLCVQGNAADRPTMFEVVSMLTNEGAVLPPPKQLAFSAVRSVNAPMSSLEICSINEATVSLLEAR